MRIGWRMPNEGITNCQSGEMAIALIQVYPNQLNYGPNYKPKIRMPEKDSKSNSHPHKNNFRNTPEITA